MQPGDHYCGIYASDRQRDELTLAFISDGIRQGHQVIYVVEPHLAAEMQRTLAVGGVDVDGLVERGQLVLVSSKDAYLSDGLFDPDKMTLLLDSLVDKAEAAGYPCLRVTAEATWALYGLPGSERLVEYEAKVNRCFASKKLIGLCVYDRRRFDTGILADIVQTHPSVLFDGEALDNRGMYFIPPDEFLGNDRCGAVLDRWLANLQQASAA